MKLALDQTSLRCVIKGLGADIMGRSGECQGLHEVQANADSGISQEKPTTLARILVQEVLTSSLVDDCRVFQQSWHDQDLD